MVSAAAGAAVPAGLLHKLRRGGRVLAPVTGRDGAQALVAVDCGEDGPLPPRRLCAASFVPLVGA